MSRIFISYKRVDKDKVFKIKDQIESALGEKCWIDVDGIESDAVFANKIIRAINNSEVFLFMYSKAHIEISDYENDWTIRELNFAQMQKKRIVFINIDGSELTDWFKLLFGTKQQVDATKSKCIDKLIFDIKNWLPHIVKSQYTSIAYISYMREDEQWAIWLQNKLEHYKLPTETLRQKPNLEFAKNPRHVFMQTTSLSAGDLANTSKEGLDSSKFLIVICSPQATKSEFVNLEIQNFIDSGREENIIPFIIDGEPYSKNPESECLPDALKMLAMERQLLGININERGKDLAITEIIARLFGLKFESLYNKFTIENKKKRLFIYTIVISIAIVMVSAAVYILKKNADIANEYQLLEKQKIEINAQKDSISNVYNQTIKQK